MKQIIIAVVALFVFGCSTSTKTVTIEDPYTLESVTENKGPYSNDKTVVIKSDKKFRECLSRNAQHMGYPAVEEYCGGKTKARPSQVGVPSAFGYGGGYGHGSGFIVQGRPPVRGYHAWAYPGNHSMYGHSVGQPSLEIVQAGQGTTPTPLVTRSEHKRDLAPLYERASNHENRLHSIEGESGAQPDSETKPATPDK